MADCGSSILESIVVSDINNNLITLTQGDKLTVKTNNLGDEILKISTAGANLLAVTLMPGAGVATDASTADPYAILYDGTTSTWTRLISEDAGNKLVVGTDGGLFTSLGAADIGTIFKISSGDDGVTVAEGPFNVELTDRLHYYSDGSLDFITDFSAGVGKIQGKAVLSSTSGNQLTLDGTGLFVPQTSNVITTLAYTNGIVTYTNEAATVFNLNINASNLRIADTHDILLSGIGAITNIQALFDQLVTLSGSETLTTLGYNSTTNKLSYLDELGAITSITLNTGQTSILGTNTPVMQMDVSGTGSALNPYILTPIFKGRFPDLLDVNISQQNIGDIVYWTGSSYDLKTPSTTSANTNSYIRSVILEGAVLKFEEGGDGDAWSGDINFQPLISSIGNSFVQTVALVGTDLTFTGIGSAYNASVPLASLIGGGYTFSTKDKQGTITAITNAEVLGIIPSISTTDLIKTTTVVTGSGHDIEIAIIGTGASSGFTTMRWDMAAQKAYWGSSETDPVVKESFSITEFARNADLEALINGKIFFVVPQYMAGKAIKRYKVTVPTAHTGSALTGDLRVDGVSVNSFSIADGVSTKNVSGLNIILVEDQLIDVVLTAVGTTTPGTGMNVVVTIE